MLDSLVTVLAVVVGGVLTYFVQARLDERKSDRERKKEQAAADAESRVAIRLEAEELDMIALHHAIIALGGVYPVTPPDFPTTTWEANKRTLAASVDDETWKEVAMFMHGLPHTRTLLSRGEYPAPLPPERLEIVRSGARVARSIHERLVGTPAPSVNESGEPSQG
jgi:hypothetical protein